jgi:hypothetical protein
LAGIARLTGRTRIALGTGLARVSGFALRTGLAGIAGVALDTRLALRSGGAGLGSRDGNCDDGGLALASTQAQRCNKRKNHYRAVHG